MANYDSPLYSKQARGGSSPPVAAGEIAVTRCFVSKVAVDINAALNDVIRFGFLPPGATIVDAALISDDLDTNGAPTITLSVGDAVLATRIFNGSLAAQAGTADRRPVTAAIGFQFTAKTLIFATVSAAAATKQAGSVTLILNYTLEGLPTS